MKQLSSLSLKVFRLIAGILIFTYFLYLWKFRGREPISSDGYSYYVFLPATFIYHDLTMKYIQELPVEVRDRSWVTDYPGKGYKISKFTCGTAILMSPFFLIGHGIALLSDEPPNGYSEPYQSLIFFAAIAYFLAGLYFLRKALLYFFSERLTALVLLIPFFATNLINYILWEPSMSHVYSFFLVSLLVYLTIRWHRDFKSRHFILALLVLGMITLIRPPNLLVALFPVLYGVNDSVLWKRKFAEVFTKPFLLFAGILVFLLPVSLQLMLWKYQTGTWLVDSYIGEHFFFDRPHLGGVLFGFRSGWLIYTPIMVFALAGFYSLFKRRYPFSWAIVLFFFINLYITSCWWCFWYGGAFGMRPFTDTYALLLLPLTACLKDLFTRKATRVLTLLALAFFGLLNIFQQFQFQHGIIHYADMTPQAYAAVFGRITKPGNFELLLEPADGEMAKQGKPMRRFFRPENLGMKIEKEEAIALKGHHGKFISADGGYEGKVIADRDDAKAWETFRIVYLDGRCLFKTWDDKWLYTGDDGFLRMDKFPAKETVAYKLHALGGDSVTIEDSKNRFLSVDDGDKPFLVASTEKQSSRAIFRLERK